MRDKKKGSGDFVKGGQREVATDVTEGGEENGEEEEAAGSCGIQQRQWEKG